MSFMRKFAIVGTAAVAALVLMSAVTQSTANAQAALPYQAYGSGLPAAATVQALKGTTVVGSATADALGNWLLQISGAGATAGDSIGFSVNGVAQSQTVTFQNGGFVPAPGLTLTASTTAPTAVVVPAPAKTGNAGLVGSPTGSVALVLMLGVFAAALAAGARAATHRR